MQPGAVEASRQCTGLAGQAAVNVNSWHTLMSTRAAKRRASAIVAVASSCCVTEDDSCVVTDAFVETGRAHD